MNMMQLEAFAREAAKIIKTESDLKDFRWMLTKVTVETASMPNPMSIWVTTVMVKAFSDNSRNGYPAIPYVPKMGDSKLMRHWIGIAALNRS